MKKQGQTRAFLEDIRWINRMAKERHTIAAVIVEEAIQAMRDLSLRK